MHITNKRTAAKKHGKSTNKQRARANVCTYTHTNAGACTHERTHVGMYAHTRTRRHTHTNAHVHTQPQAYTRAYTRTNAGTHTHTHTHMGAPARTGLSSEEGGDSRMALKFRKFCTKGRFSIKVPIFVVQRCLRDLYPLLSGQTFNIYSYAK